MTAEQWARAHDRLEALRKTWVPSTSTVPIRGRFHDARFGGDIEGRGAIAFRRPDALRMMLVTPAGVTAFDLWIRGDRFRMAMPLQGRIVRGDRTTSGTDLPVAFLRWWLLRPLDGRLVAATSDSYVLRDDGATYEVKPHADGSIDVERRAGATTERIHAQKPGCGAASYVHDALHLEVGIECDLGGEKSGEPDPRAFEDPDAVGPGATPP